MDGIEIIELKLHEDKRGWLGEIFRNDETPFTPAMAYMSMTRPGGIRGPHEHKEQTDYFCMIGNFRLYLWDNRESSSTYQVNKIIEISEDIPVLAIIPPGVVHAYKNCGSSYGYVLNLPDRLYRGWGKTKPVDEIRHEDDPLSAFRVQF